MDRRGASHAVPRAARRRHGLRAELPADLASARQARAADPQALAAWGMDHPSATPSCWPPNWSPTPPSTATAADRPRPAPPRRTRRPARHHLRGHRHLTGHAPAHADPGPDAERGRGLAIVAALGPLQRRPRRPGRQDHLVHPRPHRPAPTGPPGSSSHEPEAGA